MNTHPFGRWPSPLEAGAAAAARTSPSTPHSAGRWLYWLEARPGQDGRVVVVRAGRGEEAREVTPRTSNVRSKVHEYGGGAYCLLPDPPGPAAAPPEVVWVEAADQRLYRSGHRGPPVALSPEPPAGEQWRHGDLCADGRRGVVAVRERLLGDVARRDIVRYGIDGVAPPVVLASGRDFYAAPRPSPASDRLAFVAWDHPDMSWDSSEVWVGPLDAPGPAGAAGRVAGGDGHAVGQPAWSADGSLRFVWDRDGWWQPWRWPVSDPPAPPAPMCDLAAEFHGPDWALGQATMAEVGAGTVVCRFRTDGIDHLGLLDQGDGSLSPVDQACVTIGAVVAHDGGMVCLGRSARDVATLWWAPVTDGGGHARIGAFEPFAAQAPPPLAAPSVAVAEPFNCAGPREGVVHGLFFAPCLDGVAGPPGERPPLLVFCHGGPTGSAEAGFDVTVQFFTTRGFAVAAVDYAGSAGRGRALRRQLFGQWGEADVDDCIAVARHLAGRGRVDGGRMAIRGSSAGGLTALNALVRGSCFAAAATWYPVTDLLGLEATTHDFESRYVHRLVGPLPEAEPSYRARSPVNRVADITGAVFMAYGLDDRVVPPAQSQRMAAALRKRGVDCEELAFEGEGHGFRSATTVQTCLQAELAFYRRTLLGGAPR